MASVGSSHNRPTSAEDHEEALLLGCPPIGRSDRSTGRRCAAEQYLQSTEDRSHGAPLPEEKRKGRLKKKKGNKPQFDLREGLFRMSGTDLTRIDGIDVMTATTVISEAGYDMSINRPIFAPRRLYPL